MLYKDPFIVSPDTFLLIQQLMKLPDLEGFYLVGGTALALQLGHRNSIDIDLFSQDSFTVESIMEALEGKHSFYATLSKNNTILGVIDNIKTDFIRHNYPFIKPPIEEEGIRFLGLEDISAMKLHAIVQSGKRLKDFIDVYYLLQHISMADMIGYYEEKYTYSNALIALKALSYLDEIDEEIDPPKMLVPLSIPTIKTRIQTAMVKPYITF